MYSLGYTCNSTTFSVKTLRITKAGMKFMQYSRNLLNYTTYTLLLSDTGLWTIVKTGGALPLGGYGHTSVHDTQRGKIYVSGGYFSLSLTAYNLTDRLYQYDPIKRDW